MISITLIDELIKNNTNMILTGSFAAQYYGYNIKSKSNDIDFLIDSSFTNLHKIYSVFKKYINYYSLCKKNEYITDFFYDTIVKIISLNKLKETVSLNESLKYKILL